jgi:hypothetical protein
VVFQSFIAARAEPDQGIGGLSELEFLGVGGLPVIDELDPLEARCPFEDFQEAYLTVPVDTNHNQLESRLGCSLLQDKGICILWLTPSCVLSIRQCIYNHQIKVRIHEEFVPHLCRVHGSFIMDFVHSGSNART